MKKQDAKKIVRFVKLFDKLHMATFDLPTKDCNIDRKAVLEFEAMACKFFNKNITKKYMEAVKVLGE